jgi:tubulin polyglutamylase TTLL6/13
MFTPGSTLMLGWLSMQRLNHFNGMLEICRKKSLLQNISNMARLFSKHFRFIPTTFALPEQLQDLRADMKANGGCKTYILKPSGGCQV